MSTATRAENLVFIVATIRTKLVRVVTGNSLFPVTGSSGDSTGMIWKSIRLELGSTGEFPAGSVGRAYLVNLPLDDYDAVDRNVLIRAPSRATARRHWSTEPDERGQIVPSGGDWAIRCTGKKDRVLRFNSTPVRLGQQVSLIERDGTVLPLRVASIR